MLKLIYSSFLLILTYGFSCNSLKQSGHIHKNMESASNNYADSINSGLILKDTLKSSPVRITMKNIGNTHVHIKYGSPGVRGRQIWGGLVAFDEVWAAGAHDATTVHFYKNVKINNQTLQAGKYAFFAIPGKEYWTLILNKNYNQHLADEYNEKIDVIRYQCKPIPLTDTLQRLTYEIVKINDSEGIIALKWETKQVNLPFSTFN